MKHKCSLYVTLRRRPRGGLIRGPPPPLPPTFATSRRNAGKLSFYNVPTAVHTSILLFNLSFSSLLMQFWMLARCRSAIPAPRSQGPGTRQSKRTCTSLHSMSEITASSSVDEFINAIPADLLQSTAGDHASAQTAVSTVLRLAYHSLQGEQPAIFLQNSPRQSKIIAARPCRGLHAYSLLPAAPPCCKQPLTYPHPLPCPQAPSMTQPPVCPPSRTPQRRTPTLLPTPTTFILLRALR